MKLHRIHAANVSSRVEFKHEGVSLTWRGDGTVPGGLDGKAQVAHRLATCWNVCEGFPTEVLLEGALRELCEAVNAGDLARAQRALKKMDRGTDTTDGRLHDCESCLENEKKEKTDG